MIYLTPELMFNKGSCFLIYKSVTDKTAEDCLHSNLMKVYLQCSLAAF